MNKRDVDQPFRILYPDKDDFNCPDSNEKAQSCIGCPRKEECTSYSPNKWIFIPLK